MNPKKLIPASIRDALRPSYQRWKRAIDKAARSRLWVYPAGWEEKRHQYLGMRDPKSLFSFAGREFGLIQIEHEILSFVDFVAQQNPGIVGEIGLKHGGNTVLFLGALGDLQTMIALDLLIHNEGKIRSLVRRGQKLVCIQGDTHSKKVYENLAKILGEQRFDMLFIDGDHSYEGVKQDHQQYQSLVREGGLIAFHDIVPDHRVSSDSELVGDCYAGGVHRYWAEIKDKHEHREFVESWDQNGFGIGVIRVPLPRDTGRID